MLVIILNKSATIVHRQLDTIRFDCSDTSQWTAHIGLAESKSDGIFHNMLNSYLIITHPYFNL